MKTKKWLVWTALGLVLIAALFWAFRPRPLVVEAAVAALGLFEQTIHEDGLVKVRSRYMIASPNAGQAERISLRVGDLVKPGDRIVTIRPLVPALQDARELSQLREAYGAAQASQLRAKANVARARAMVQQARADYTRAQELADQGFTARSQAETASLILTQQLQNLKAAEFENQSTIHQAQMASAALQRFDGAAPDAGANSATAIVSASDPRAMQPSEVTINSPVAGYVLKVLHESEGAVSPGTDLIEVGNIHQLEAVIDVLSEDATVLKPAMLVRLKAGTNATDVLFGQISRVEPVAQTKVSTLGVEEQRVNVVVEFSTDALPIVLGDGYRVEATIVTLAERDVLLVPIGALVRDDQGWHLYVVEDGKAQLRRIEVAARNQVKAWIRSGVDAGEKVIVYPPDSLVSGSRVTLTPASLD